MERARKVILGIPRARPRDDPFTPLPVESKVREGDQGTVDYAIPGKC